MLHKIAAIMGVVLLAGCGVDGEPWTPTMGLDVGVGTSGVHSSGQIGISNGTVSVTVGHGTCWNRPCLAR